MLIIESCENLIKQVFSNIFDIENQEGKHLLVTFLEANDENIMRDYLLNPEKRFQLAKGRYNREYSIFLNIFVECG